MFCLQQIPASIEEVIDTSSGSEKSSVKSTQRQSVFDGRNKISKKRKVKEKGAKFKEKLDENVVDVVQKTIAEIVTGKGLSVPMCDGEEVASRFFVFMIMEFHLFCV